VFGRQARVKRGYLLTISSVLAAKQQLRHRDTEAAERREETKYFLCDLCASVAHVFGLGRAEIGKVGGILGKIFRNYFRSTGRGGLAARGGAYPSAWRPPGSGTASACPAVTYGLIFTFQTARRPSGNRRGDTIVSPYLRGSRQRRRRSLSSEGGSRPRSEQFALSGMGGIWSDIPRLPAHSIRAG
jgi:hypothetical protein